MSTGSGASAQLAGAARTAAVAQRWKAVRLLPRVARSLVTRVASSQRAPDRLRTRTRARRRPRRAGCSPLGVDRRRAACLARLGCRRRRRRCLARCTCGAATPTASSPAPPRKHTWASGLLARWLRCRPACCRAPRASTLQLFLWARFTEPCCLALGRCSRGALPTTAAWATAVSTTSRRRCAWRRWQACAPRRWRAATCRPPP